MGSRVEQIFEFLQRDFTNSLNELVIKFADLGQILFLHLLNYDFELLCSSFSFLNGWFHFSFLSHLYLSHFIINSRMISFFVVFFELCVCSKLSATELALTDLSMICFSLMGQQSLKWFEFLSAGHAIIATLCGERGLLLLPLLLLVTLCRLDVIKVVFIS